MVTWSSTSSPGDPVTTVSCQVQWCCFYLLIVCFRVVICVYRPRTRVVYWASFTRVSHPLNHIYGVYIIHLASPITPYQEGLNWIRMKTIFKSIEITRERNTFGTRPARIPIQGLPKTPYQTEVSIENGCLCGLAF